MRTKGTIIINLDKRKVGAAIAALGILVVMGFTANHILANNENGSKDLQRIVDEKTSVVTTSSRSIDWSTGEATTVETTTETTETTTQVPQTEETTVSETQQVAQQTVVEPITSAPVKETHYNQIEYLGMYFNVGPVFASNIYQPEGIHALSNYIDGGGIGAIGSPLNVYDGQGTHIAGHNPGVMSPFAANLEYGSVVTVHDVNGNARNYVLTSSASTPINDEGSYDNTSRANGSTEAVANQIHGNEVLIIQFCIGKTLYLFKFDAT
jgi:hypothetical protein